MLTHIKKAKSVYFIPRDDIVSDILVPALIESDQYDCMVGFFNSASLSEMAEGIAALSAKDNAKVRFLISPYLSEQDQAAIERGLIEPTELIENELFNVLEENTITANSLKKHTLQCLAYLINTNKVNFKICIVKGGLFHPKVKIFSDGQNKMAVYGSSNATQSGLRYNYEQLNVARCWASDEQAEIIKSFKKEFDSLWFGKQTNIKTYDIPKAIEKHIIKNHFPDHLPTIEDFWKAYDIDKKMHKKMSISENAKNYTQDFIIPVWIDYQTGDFSHQGKAIELWEENGRRGILEMATGAGKTITSLIAANRLYQDVEKLLIIVSAPYLPLIGQWKNEVKKFGVEPILPGDEYSRNKKFASIKKVIRRLNIGISDVECLVVTHDLLKDETFIDILDKLNCDSLLVADEVHNLGTSSFLDNTPEIIPYRIGLSATPIRQYDEEGTDRLQDYFGPIVFRFDLKDAIGKCLVPYDYHVHLVRLTQEEVEKWVEISDSLKGYSWAFEEYGLKDLPDNVSRLIRERRLILEQPRNKLSVFKDVFRQEKLNTLRHTLIYASDKGREQLTNINNFLIDELGLKVHQITAEETKDGELVDDIFDKFQKGKGFQALTAMRVLDEGVNIPEISKAYILASTTVERQWIQRRGRVLRKSSKIDKKKAVIHDFIVAPPESIDHLGRISEFSKIIEAEVKRIMAFAELSLNAAKRDGPLSVIRPLIDDYF